MERRRLQTLDRFLELPGDSATAEDNLRPPELAKYQEHREKDPETALETVDVLLSLEATKRQKAKLLHRRKRLVGKC